MSTLAQRYSFITETSNEPITLAIFGEDEVLIHALISEVRDSKQGFAGIWQQGKKSELQLDPYRIIAILPEAEEGRVRILSIVHQFTLKHVVPIVVVTPERHTQDVENLQHAVVLIARENYRGFEQELAKQVIDEVFSERRTGIQKYLKVPRRIVEELEAPVMPPAPLYEPPKPAYVQVKHPQFSHLPQERQVSPRQHKHEDAPKHHIVHEKLPPRLTQIPSDIPFSAVFSHEEPKELFVEHLGQPEVQEDVLHQLFHVDKPEDAHQHTEKHEERSRTSVRKMQFQWNASWRKIAMVCGGVVGLLAILVLPPLLLRMQFLQAAQSILNPSLFTLQPKEQQKDIDRAARTTQWFELAARGISPIYAVLGKSAQAEDMRAASAVIDKGAVAFDAYRNYLLTMTKAYGAVMGEQNQDDSLTLLTKATLQLETSSKELSVFAAELHAQKQNAFLEEVGKLDQIEKHITALRTDVVKHQHLLSIAPDFLGQNTKKTYLVLIQNPQELRSSGGFLEAYALLTFDKGRLLDVQVQDAVSADAQLKGKIDPPVDLRTYLGESQWYFRDSNWDPQFPVVARQAEWFIQKSLGRDVDGTLAINAYVLQDLLRATGPITLSSSNNEEITADNLMERLQTKSEMQFNTQAGKNTGFLTSVSSVIFTALQKLDQSKVPAVGAALTQALENNQAVLSVKDVKQERELSLLGVNGGVMTPPCPQSFSQNQCFVDTIYQVDANVGINRANYTLKRLIDHQVILSKTTAAHDYTVRYTNTATTAVWPNGIYKNYVRIYLPDFTQVNTVLVDQKSLASSELNQTIMGNKRFLGFYLEVPVGKTVVVDVKYVTQLSPSQAFSYALFTQKQPGTAADPLSVSFATEKPLRVTRLAPEGAIVGNVIQFDTTLDKHQYLAVELQ